MLEAQAIVERVRRLSPSIQQLDLAVDAAHAEVQPGHLFLARTTDSLDPFLREPWMPVRRDKLSVTVELPVGKVYAPAQVVSLVGPVGRPIPVRDSVRNLLLITHEATPAALVLLAENALRQRLSVSMLLLGASRQYPLDALPPEMEVIHAVDLASWDSKMNLIQWAQQIVAVSAPPLDGEFYATLLDVVSAVMMKVQPGLLYGLYHPPLPCGVGACAACLVRHGAEDVPACTEGPALDLTITAKHREAAS
jgi:hypothetical protein